jgi:hypothetical protein
MDERRDVSSLRVFFVCVSCVSWFGFSLNSRLRVPDVPRMNHETCETHEKDTKTRQTR